MSTMLQDKVVIVTGSTTGIGRSIAEMAVQQGGRVVIHGRDRQRGERLQEALSERAIFVADDLADPAAAGRIVHAAMDRFGRLDALVNNAASVRRSNLDSTSAADFDLMMAINVRAPMLLIQAARPHLRASRGCIANIGSVNALGGEPNLLAYSISKGGLATLSKNLANALGPEQIRVVHFNVGWVLTENEYHQKIADGLQPGWPERLTSQVIPSGRMTRPEEVAAVVTYWISDQSRPFSGTVMELEQFPFAGRNCGSALCAEESDSS
jgi:NAD(P)-dependent dehydrogenase (short-subunit alcohol dehydrogenase family)